MSPATQINKALNLHPCSFNLTSSVLWQIQNCGKNFMSKITKSSWLGMIWRSIYLDDLDKKICENTSKHMHAVNNPAVLISTFYYGRRRILGRLWPRQVPSRRLPRLCGTGSNDGEWVFGQLHSRHVLYLAWMGVHVFLILCNTSRRSPHSSPRLDSSWPGHADRGHSG